MPANSFIITGNVGAGKSSLCLRVVTFLQSFPVTIGGVITIQEEKKYFYLITRNQKISFEAGHLDEFVPIGRFKIHRHNLERVLSEIALEIGNDFFFIDEIGYLELEKGGYYPILDKVFDREKNTFVVVKERILDELTEKYLKLGEYQVIRVENWNYDCELNFIKESLIESLKESLH